MTKNDFVNSAKEIRGTIGGQPIVAKPRVFESGNVGYNITGKMRIALPDGGTGRIQISGSTFPGT